MQVRRSLATVLFTDIVSSTERAAALGDREWRALLQRHHALVRRELGRHGGREMATAGDGFLALFENSADAILAACAIRDAVGDLDLEIRAGLHAGQVEWEGESVGGIAVHIGARVAALASPGEVLVSSTVHDLEVGSGFGFVPRGFHTLKGVPGEWRLFGVTSCPSAPAIAASAGRAAQGRGILVGGLTFVGLFLLAGLYLSRGEADRNAGAAGDSTRAAGIAAADSGAYPAAGEGSRKGARVPVPVPAARAGAAESLLSAPAPGGTPPAEGAPAAPPWDAAETRAAAPVAPQPERAETPAAADVGRLRSTYESALAMANDARQGAVQAGASGLREALLRRGDAARREGRSAATRGRYAEATLDLTRAAREYDGARERMLEQERAEALARAAPPAPPPPAATDVRPRFGPPAAEPPPPPPPPARVTAPAPAPAAPALDAEGAVRGALAALRAAIEAEDLNALRRSWVSLGRDQARGFEHWFDQVRDIQVRHQPTSVRANGETLVAEVQTTYEFFNESTGRDERRDLTQILELREQDGRWVVVASRQ